MKILVIEDEKKIASFIRKGLEAQGFVVDVSHHGDEGFTVATTRPYDAIVLDIMLPGKDGLSILRSLRERKMAVPVILLTARSELNERLEGLNLGADDYLTKPFFIEELIARLHVVTRRASGASQSILAVGRSDDEPAHPRSGAGERKIELTAREFALLESLMRSPGRVLTRAQICERVWDYDFDPGHEPRGGLHPAPAQEGGRRRAGEAHRNHPRRRLPHETGRMKPLPFRLKIALLSAFISGLVLVASAWPPGC